MKPEAFLLDMLDDCVEKDFEILCLQTTTAARILCAKHWKSMEISSVKNWWMKVSELAEMDKLRRGQ